MLSPELREWLEQVIKNTEARTIKWGAPNPTTYFWEITTPTPARVVLQRIERKENYQQAPGRIATRTVVQYILTASDLRKPQIPEMSLNGMVEPDVNPLLEKLYTSISTVVTRDSVEFLRSLLPQKAPDTQS